MVVTGTTTAAGRQLGISQSAVSRAIAKLEARLNRTLFIREDGRMQPTAEAITLNETLNPIFDSLNQIHGTVQTSGKRRTLRIASPPTIAHRFLQSRIGHFVNRSGNVSVDFEICPADTLEKGILDRRFDIAVSDIAPRNPGVKVVPFRKSKMICAMPLDHGLCSKKVVDPEHLEGQSLITMTKRQASRSNINQMLINAGVEANIIIETSTVVSAIEFVRFGLGITLLNPFPVALTLANDVAIRAFEPGMEYRTSFLLPAAMPQSSTARAFMRHIRATTPDDAWSQAYR
ncbi:MAG: LysR family transcriptional regulator [Hyphomicrobiaceae bacterium]|nr:LysR family transcriptional regulator [Hyphomicrobiaceae bacterium]